jgi:hypothetical protein
VAILVVDVLLLGRVILPGIRTQQITFGLFALGLVVLFSIPAVLLVAYHTASCFTLRYRMDRNGLFIRWLGGQQIVPIREIQRMVAGAEIEGPVSQRRGFRWPGHERGTGQVPGVGLTRFLATRPLADQLLVVTPDLAFGISPRDAQALSHAYDTRRKLGPNRLLDRSLTRAGWFAWSLWSDQTAWGLLGTAVAVNVGLFGYLSARYPGLDQQLPLHFNIQGVVDRIGTRIELFSLPIIGLIILGTNLVLGLILYRRERAGAYLLWGAAVAAQVLFWLAAFSIVA